MDDSKKCSDLTQQFYVVQKVQCLQAFKELEKRNEFKGLYGHQSGKVLCYLLNTNRSDIIQYGNARENMISSQCVRKFGPQEILHHFHCLTMKEDSSVNVVMVAERMAKLACVGPDECTALSKLCKWTGPAFAALMEVVDVFEHYKTLDVKSSGNQQALEMGLKMRITNILLRRLGKVTEKYFIENYEQVIKNKISLRELTENFLETVEVEKVYSSLSLISNFASVEALITAHPGKFEFKKMITFIGAVWSKTSRNELGARLEKYHDSVVADSGEEFENPVEFVAYQDIKKVFDDEDISKKSDLIIFVMSDLDKNVIGDIIAEVLGGVKEFHAAVLVFARERDYFDVLTYLRSQESTTSLIKDFKLVPLLFKVDPKSKEEVVENVMYGLVFGKLTLLKSPFVVNYGDLCQLRKVVESTCPAKKQIALVCGLGVPSIKLHGPDFDKKVTYYASELEILRFKKKLAADKTPVVVEETLSDNDEEEYESDEEEEASDDEDESAHVTSEGQEPEETTSIASTSNTPAKLSSAGTGMDDSGIFEDRASVRSLEEEFSLFGNKDEKKERCQRPPQAHAHQAGASQGVCRGATLQ